MVAAEIMEISDSGTVCFKQGKRSGKANFFKMFPDVIRKYFSFYLLLSR